MEQARSAARLDKWGLVYLVMGGGLILNACWMFIDPGHWYAELPAAVPDTGPLNHHFVRDIGCAFLTAGVALVWAALDASHRLPLVGTATLFLTGHAVLHVYDTSTGALPHAHWWLDFPGVYLPALVCVWGTIGLARAPVAAPR